MTLPKSDNRDIRKWFQAAPDDPDGIWHSFPMQGVTCANCGMGGCLMYPDPGEDDGAPEQHRPSTICPRCSTHNVESFIRFRAEQKGYTLKPIGVFTTDSIPTLAPIKDRTIIAASVVRQPRHRRECAACGEPIDGRQIRLYRRAETGDPAYALYEHPACALEIRDDRVRAVVVEAA